MCDIPLPITASDIEFDRLIEWAKKDSASSDEIALLAKHLADSGEKLAWPNTYKIADLASTGGPGSLSTLLSPLALINLGYRVVKLAVPGRPAGAIDTLGTLPGYRVNLSVEDVRTLLTNARFAHFLADDRFAPLDRVLFSYRRRVGAVSVPILAIASLLAKKLAVGVSEVGLDVRVGRHGNFGATHSDARRNAERFCSTAKLLGINAVAFLNCSYGFAQPWIGRGESLVAMAHVLGVRGVDDYDSLVNNHATGCFEMANLIVTSGELPKSQKDKFIRPSEKALRDTFEEHLKAQGSNLEAFRDRVNAIATAPKQTITADASGIVKPDISIIRDVLVKAQEDSVNKPFSDPAGIVLLTQWGSMVEKGQSLATVRCSEGQSEMKIIVNSLRSAFRIIPPGSGISKPDDFQLEIVR